MWSPSRVGPGTLYIDPDLGKILIPQAYTRRISLPNAPVRRSSEGEGGIFVAKQYRNVIDAETGKVVRREMIWHSITHNERVDAGAAIQANRLFGTAGTTANGVFTAGALASANITKTKTDLSLGSASANATTNEFTTIGLSRATLTVGSYTAPASLGATFAQALTKTFTATGTGTVWGAGVFDSTTVSGSNLYVEDLFGSTAVMNNTDTLALTVTLTN